MKFNFSAANTVENVYRVTSSPIMLSYHILEQDMARSNCGWLDMPESPALSLPNG